MKISKDSSVTIAPTEKAVDTLFLESQFFLINHLIRRDAAFKNCVFIDCSPLLEKDMENCITIYDIDMHALTFASPRKYAKMEREVVKHILRTFKNAGQDTLAGLQTAQLLLTSVRKDRDKVPLIAVDKDHAE